MTEEPSPPDALQSLSEALDFWATVTPDAVALLAPGRPPMSYRELQEAIDRLASELRALGLARQAGLALIFPEGPDLCLALLAAMTAGIAVPLPWPAPDEAYRYVLANRRIQAVVVSSAIPPPALERADRPLPVVTLTAGTSGRLGDALLAGRRWGDPVAAAPLAPPS